MVSVGRAITLPPFKDLTATFRMLCCAESLTCKKKRHKINGVTDKQCAFSLFSWSAGQGDDEILVSGRNRTLEN